MIDQLLHPLFLASVTTTYLSSLLILFRKNLLRLIGARWSYYLWFTIFMPWLIVWIPLNVFPDIDVADSTFPSLILPIDTHNQIGPIQIFSLSNILSGIWIYGAVIVFCYFIISHLVFAVNIKMKAFALTINEQKTAKYAFANKDQIPLSRIYLSTLITSTLICHIIKSHIYLPSNFFEVYSRDEQKYILQHECVHYQRCDLIANSLMLLLVSMNWFNPIIILSYRYFRVTQELSCDAILSYQFSSAEKISYGNTLLKSAIEQSSHVPIIICRWNNKKLLEERCSMLKFHCSKPLKNLLGVIFLAILTCTALVAPGFGKIDDSADLKIANSSEEKLSFGINNQCLKIFGVMNSHSMKVIPYKRLRQACIENPSNCEIKIFSSKNCHGNVFAMLIFNLSLGQSGIMGFSNDYKLELDGNNLFIDKNSSL